MRYIGTFIGGLLLGGVIVASLFVFGYLKPSATAPSNSENTYQAGFDTHRQETSVKE